MISNNVINEVLKIKTLSKSHLKNDNTFVISKFSCFHKIIIEINIYELAHKCKDWAYNQGFIYWYENNKLYIKRMFSCKVDFEVGIGIYNKPFDIDIDFKACKWILDNKLNKGK